MQLPDGVVMPQMQGVPNPYPRYPYAPEQEQYNVPTAHSNYAFPATSKPYEKPSQEDLSYGYSTYTPSQFSSNSDQQANIYSNPYYSSTPNNSSTIVTDTQSFTNMGQVNANPVNIASQNQYYDAYTNQMGSIPETSVGSMSTYSAANQTELNTNFAQMHLTGPKDSNYAVDYSQTYYSIQYPNVSTPNPNTYTNATQNTSTIMAPSQIPSDYSSLNYPYSEVSQYTQVVPPNTPYNASEQPYSYDTSFASTSQGLTYTNAVTSVSSIDNSSSTAYSFPSDIDSNYNPALAQLDAFDKPIKSHVTGEALSNMHFQPSYQNYNSTEVPNYSSQSDTYNTPSNFGYSDQSNTSYGQQTYQNHPGYNFNTSTGNYEYNYGSQNTFSGYDNTVQQNVNSQEANKDPNWQPQGIYTSAGKVSNCETVQSPTENSQVLGQPQNQASANQGVVNQGSINQGTVNQGAVNQTYYAAPYGYQTTKPEEFVPNSQPVSTNYGADVNQSTYMQSGHGYDTSVTYASNQGKTS